MNLIKMHTVHTRNCQRTNKKLKLETNGKEERENEREKERWGNEDREVWVWCLAIGPQAPKHRFAPCAQGMVLMPQS